MTNKEIDIGVSREEIVNLLTVLVAARSVTIMCAPQFPIGSEGHRAVDAIRNCMPQVQSVLERLKEQENREAEKKDDDNGASPAPDMV